MNMKATNSLGFTLIESILVICLMGLIGVIVLTSLKAPLDLYRTSQSQVMLSLHYKQLQMIMQQQLQMAWPDSIQVSGNGSQLIFHKKIETHSATVLSFQDKTAITMPTSANTAAISHDDMAYINIKGLNQMIAVQSARMADNLVFIPEQPVSGFHEGQQVEVTLLSGPYKISLQAPQLAFYHPKGQLIARIGHVSNISLNWEAVQKQLNMSFTLKNSYNHLVTYVDHMFYDEP